jgi:hypothetical protein
LTEPAKVPSRPPASKPEKVLTLFQLFAQTCTVFVLLAAAVHWWAGPASPSPLPCVPDSECRERAESPRLPESPELEKRLKAHEEFVAFIKPITAQIAQGQLHLPAARDAVFTYCLAHYPVFLDNLQRSERGAGLKEKLEINLSRTVRLYWAEHGMSSPGLLHQVELVDDPLGLFTPEENSHRKGPAVH